MSSSPLAELYLRYVDCLNARTLDRLGSYVRDDVRRNGEAVHLAGYREMLHDDFRRIPDLRFTIELLVADATHVAARLAFDCTPVGEFVGVPVQGRRVSFHENVFYVYVDGKIADVRSVVDTDSIRAQLLGPRAHPPAGPEPSAAATSSGRPDGPPENGEEAVGVVDRLRSGPPPVPGWTGGEASEPANGSTMVDATDTGPHA